MAIPGQHSLCQRIPNQVGLGRCNSVSPRSDAALPQPCPVAPLLLPLLTGALWPSKWVCTLSPSWASSNSRDSRTSCSTAALVNRLRPPFGGLRRVLRLALDQPSPCPAHVVVPVNKHRRDACSPRLPSGGNVLESSDADRFRTSPSCRASSASSPAVTSARQCVLGRRRGSSLLLPQFVRAGLHSMRNAASVGAKIESTLVFLNCLTSSRARMSTFVASPWLITSQRPTIGAAPTSFWHSLFSHSHSTLRTCRTLRPPFSTRPSSSGSPVISS